MSRCRPARNSDGGQSPARRRARAARSKTARNCSVHPACRQGNRSISRRNSAKEVTTASAGRAGRRSRSGSSPLRQDADSAAGGGRLSALSAASERSAPRSSCLVITRLLRPARNDGRTRGAWPAPSTTGAGCASGTRNDSQREVARLRRLSWRGERSVVGGDRALRRTVVASEAKARRSRARHPRSSENAARRA